MNIELKPKFQRVLLKLSGEALVGSQSLGIDAKVLDRIAAEIKLLLCSGVQVAVVLGGGNLFRGEGLAAAGMNRVVGDHMGMLATVMNGLALRDALHRADVNAHMPAGHTWTCADCKQELRHEVGVNNVPLCHSPADLKNMRLPVWISYGEVWKGTYCNCVSLCNSCLDKFYSEVCTSILDINEKEEKYEEEKKHMPSSSLETQVDYLSPTGNPDMPTRQLRALMRTVLVQIREAIFSIMCNRVKDQQP